MTAETVAEYDVVLCVGDTTFLDYGRIVEKLVTKHTRVIHVFDREGDITEVFDKIRQLQHTGVVVRAAHNRSLDSDSEVLTAGWAVEAIARLGGYLEHRHRTPIGIQVLWRGWLKLHDLCEGLQLATET
ncbi:hypothetical protein F8S12_26895 [Nostoc sp. WHI]|nr:hypothetical protein [Nostoc sp. WHI]MBG1267871.1 hypothetical protein [Nostoc sp. WHI]MBG1269747.1 hypothetical protein [Nostoc sp. WHI]